MFQRAFIETKGQPIMYNGNWLHMMDRLPIAKKQRIRIVFESTSSEWRQGVCLRTTGSVEVNDQRISDKGIVLWADTAPPVVEATWHTRSGLLEVWNVWDVGDGTTHSWHNGGAMIIEELPSGRRYRCNDGYPDDDFDDLVFRLEVL